MERTRAFIAIELPQAVKDDLDTIVERLRPREHPYVKWVRTEGIHLTLKFLGDIDSAQVQRIEEAIAHASQGLSPFTLHLDGLGCFPNPNRPRVVWVAAAGDVEPLATLQRAVERDLAPIGFPAERRAFTSHLTLGRLRERATPGERGDIGGLVAAAEGGGEEPFQVGGVSLMRSNLTPGGAIYSRLAFIELKAE